jgi:NAD(P)-dependent dehydrogenase (short-subunit alcohol dehydrogenase family)
MNNNILNSFALHNKKILVTGASSGIGKQTAIHIAELGGKVCITGRNKERLDHTLHLLKGDGHISKVADLTIAEEVSSLVDILPAFDGVVHAAGIVSLYPAKYINKEEIDKTFSVNYIAPVQLMTQLFKQKKINKNCSIVFISSFSAKYPYALGALYTGSKSALENYAKSLAVENAQSGLRANCILPALVKTNIYENTMNGIIGDNAQEKINKYSSFYLRGIGEPEDVANTATFLLSDASKWITGQSIVIDGGYLLGLLSKMLD